MSDMNQMFYVTIFTRFWFIHNCRCWVYSASVYSSDSLSVYPSVYPIDSPSDSLSVCVVCTPATVPA
jgi:hypothetical protein